MAEPREPDRIDIGLTLVDRAGMQALQDLTNQLSTVAQQLGEWRAPTAQAAQREARRTGGLLGRVAHGIRSATASTPDQGPDPVQWQAQGNGASSGMDTVTVRAQNVQVIQQSVGQATTPGGPSVADPGRQEEVLRRSDEARIQLQSPTYRGRLRESLGHISRGTSGTRTQTLLDLLPPPPAGSAGDDYGYVSGQGGGPRGHDPANVTLAEAEAAAGGRGRGPGGPSRPPDADMTPDDDPFGDDHPRRSESEEGGPSDGSVPAGPRAFAAMRHLRGLDINEPIQIPRYGEFTIQDKLNMASDWLARGGYRANRASRAAGGDPEAGVGRLQSAALLNQAAAYSPYIAGLGQSIMRRTGLTQGSSGPLGLNINPTQNTLRGAAQGYDRAGADVTIPGTHIGFQLPGPLRFLTEAGREGLRTSVEQVKLAARSEITKEQAAAITEAVESRGWRGDQQRRMVQGAGDLFSLPGLNQLNPDLGVGLMDQSLRYGNSSVKDFVETMRGLPDAAKAAKVSIDEMASGLEEMGNAVQEQGGTFREGLQRGTEFSSITGLPPQAGTKLMQNPVVQSNMFLKTGLIPQVQGLAPTGSLTGSTYDSLKQMVGIFDNMPDTVIRGASGKTTISGERQAIALAGQQLGLTPDEAISMWHNGKRIQTASRLETSLEGYQQERSKALRSKRGLGGLGGLEVGDQKGRYNFADLENLMRSPDLNFSDKEIEGIRDAHNPAEQRARLSEAIANHVPDSVEGGKDKVQIDLTDDAKRWFKQIDGNGSDLNKGKRQANKGKDSTVQQYGSGAQPGTNDPRLRGAPRPIIPSHR